MRERASAPSGIAHVVLVIAAHGASAVAAAWGVEQLLARSPGWSVAYLGVAFFIGSRFRAVGNMIHEACHSMLVRGRRPNRLLGHFLSVVDFTDFNAYTTEHLTHHRFLGNPANDLDFNTRMRFGFGEPLGYVAWRHVFFPLTLLHVLTYLRPVFWSRDDPALVKAARALYVFGLLALAHWGIGWRAFALYYVVPYVTTYQIMRYWSDAIDHAGIISSEREFDRSRNHVIPWAPLNLLVFPRNDQYHLVHHLFPAVPTPMQPAVHRLLLDDPEYAVRQHRLLIGTAGKRLERPSGDAAAEPPRGSPEDLPGSGTRTA